MSRGTTPASPTEDRYRSRWTWDSVATASHCVDCYPGSCPLRVYLRDGRVWREEQSGTLETVEEGVPDFNPMGCQKGAAWSQQLYGPDRLLYPMRRAGERGEGRWERIGWDEACTAVADAMLDAIEEIGPQAIVLEGPFHMAAIPQTARFLNLVGGRMFDFQGVANDFSAGLHETFATSNPVSSADDWFHSELIFVWHMNPAYTRIPVYHFMLEARYRGAEVVSISPDLNASHLHSDYWVPIPPGNDAPLALAMVQVVLSEGLADWTFIREQTDLSFLVRQDTGRYLRQTDVDGPSGREDQLYQWDPDEGLVAADRSSMLLHGREVALEGSYAVTLHDGTTVACEPVLGILRGRLDAQYTPERQTDVTRVHPEVVRMLARKAAAKRTNIMLGFNSAKYFHGDLIERAMCLLLAVTGNWGKKGTGIRSWAVGMLDGYGSAMAKQRPGVEAAEAILGAQQAAIDMMRKRDPSATELVALRELLQGAIRAGQRAGSAPPAFWWYGQAGYEGRWNTKEWGDTTLQRSFGDYLSDAVSRGWWTSVEGATGSDEPRVLLECGGNILRRARGGQTVLLESLWPKLNLVVCIDNRMSATALHADIVLPAAQQYEKAAILNPTPHVMHLAFSDRAATPPGEAKAEWEIFTLICRRLGERAEARGILEYTDARGGVYRPAELWDRYTLGGRFPDEAAFLDEAIRDSAHAGTLPEGTTLQTLRERGHVRFTAWGKMPMALAQGSPFPVGETHTPFRDHVERGVPFATYARRAQFYIDHPWWLEALEELPVHKPNPAPGGGHYPLRLTSGHNRWSIHALNMGNPILLQTHRGEPHVVVSVEDAQARSVADHDLVRVWNDIASFVARAKVSPSVRPGQVVSYNGWDAFQYAGWKGTNEIEAGMAKWTGLAGGYGHIQYMPVEWQPVATDRGAPCEFELVAETDR